MRIKKIMTGFTALAITSLCLIGCSEKKEESSKAPAPLIKAENEQIATEPPTEPPVEKKYNASQITQRDEKASQKEFEINLKKFDLLSMTPASLNGFAEEYKDEAEPFIYQNDDFSVYGIPYKTNESVTFYIQAVYNETAGNEFVGQSTNYIDNNVPEQYDIVSVTFTRDGYLQGMNTGEDFYYFNFNLADIIRLNMTKEQVKSRTALTTPLPNFDNPTYLIKDSEDVLMYITFVEDENGEERVDRITLMKNGYQNTTLHEVEIPAPTEPPTSEIATSEMTTYAVTESGVEQQQPEKAPADVPEPQPESPEVSESEPQ